MHTVTELQNENELLKWFDSAGLGYACKNNRKAYVKVNLPTPHGVDKPFRTSAKLITQVANYLQAHNTKCIIIESANGLLEENLRKVGLGQALDNETISYIDLDKAEAEPVVVKGREYYLPTGLDDSEIRIGLSVASQRPDAIFSNAVKLHFGTTPSRYYGIEGHDSPRAKLHDDLQLRVAEVYMAVHQNIPFNWNITEGPYMIEDKTLHEKIRFAGKYAPALDDTVLLHFGLEEPRYLKILRKWLH